MRQKMSAWILLASVALVLGLPPLHAFAADHGRDDICVYCASTADWTLTDEGALPHSTEAPEITNPALVSVPLSQYAAPHQSRAPPVFS